MSERDGRILTSRSEATRHTPGPWKVWSSLYEGMKAAVVNDEGERLITVAEVRQSYADALLIARAPELLQFARAVLGDAIERKDDALAEYAASLIGLSTGRVLKWRESNGSSLKNSTEGMVE